MLEHFCVDQWFLCWKLCACV